MQKKYADEIKKLEAVYSGIIEAILSQPDTADYEKSRIYFENVVAHMNNWAVSINQVKKQLEERDPNLDLSTDNRPA
jgi:hypothetical protein